MDDGRSEHDLPSIHCLYLYRQKFGQSIEARLQPSTFAMSPFSHLRDRLFVFRQASGTNYTLSTHWRNFQYCLVSAKTISSYLELTKAHSPDDMTTSYFVDVAVLSSLINMVSWRQYACEKFQNF